jgi:hypothetical protein
MTIKHHNKQFTSENVEKATKKRFRYFLDKFFIHFIDYKLISWRIIHLPPWNIFVIFPIVL